jgi:hypothetical protein
MRPRILASFEETFGKWLLPLLHMSLLLGSGDNVIYPAFMYAHVIEARTTID